MHYLKTLLLSWGILTLLISVNQPLKAEGKNSVKLDATSLFTNLNTQMAMKNIITYPSTQNMKRQERMPLQLDAGTARAFFYSPVESFQLTNFPIQPGVLANVELKRARSAVDGNTKYYRRTATGLEPIAAPPVVASFYGTIINEPGSKVFISYVNGEMYGYIDHADGIKYDIVPDKETNISGAHFISDMNRNTEKNENGESFVCGTDEYDDMNSEQNEELKKELSKINIQGSALYIAPITVEAAYDYYALLGSNADRVNSYIISVMTHASKLYEDEINVIIYVNSIVLNDNKDTDPYKGTTDLSQKLMSMPSVWPNGQPDGTALVVLFASLNSQPGNFRIGGISFGGQAGIGSLCSKKRGFCVFGIDGSAKFDHFNYTWDVSVAAHEMGHNFSAPHTHNCYFLPQVIDTCVTQTLPTPVSDACFSGNPVPRPGTLMSYCHLSNTTKSVEMFFSYRVAKLMRAAVTKSSCMVNVKDPTVRLLAPLGGELYKMNSIINVRWTSIGVSSVNLKFSTDNGYNWTYLDKNISAADSIHPWNTTGINAPVVKFVVEDSFNPAVNDSSIATFAILQPKIQVLVPVPAVRIGQKEAVTVRWSKTLVDLVNVLFSSDGGNNWTTIKENYSSLDCTFDAPDILSDQCIVKVIDSKYSTIVNQSGLFSIGIEKLTAVAPIAGEQVCAKVPYPIRWSSEFLTFVYIEYSIENSNVWSRLTFNNIPAADGKYTWIPDTTLMNHTCMLRFSSKSDTKTILSQSEPFNVVWCVNGVDNNEAIANTLKITDVSPNPASSIARITFSNGTLSQSVRGYIVDGRGAMVGSEFNFSNIKNGINTIDISVSGITSGAYFIVLKSGDFTSDFPLRIGK